MTTLDGELSPRRIGAEILYDCAKQHRTGRLVWERTNGSVQIDLYKGKPVRGSGLAQLEANAHEHLVLVVRAFACALTGTYHFTEETVAPGQHSVDPLGEALVAIHTAMSESQLEQLWTTRANQYVTPTAAFAPIRAACVQVSAVDVELSTQGAPLCTLVSQTPLAVQRTVAALLCLGGLSAKLFDPPTKGAAPEHQALAAEITATHVAMHTQDHYQVLGVPRDATTEVIRKSYFELAKRWHSDRFSGMELGAARTLAEEVFRRIEEAQHVLSDPEQRRTYDFVLARQAEGLPTDATVILEAETLFKKAEALVRRGQPHSALDLLSRAVQLNRGEAEFWIYLGYAMYAVHGTTAYAEAQEHIHRGLKMSERSDVAYEFLGRMARIEGHLEEACKQLRRALDLNPGNFDAERELRLITMRSSKPTPHNGLRGLLGKLTRHKPG